MALDKCCAGASFRRQEERKTPTASSFERLAHGAFSRPTTTTAAVAAAAAVYTRWLRETQKSHGYEACRRHRRRRRQRVGERHSSTGELLFSRPWRIPAVLECAPHRRRRRRRCSRRVAPTSILLFQRPL